MTVLSVTVLSLTVLCCQAQDDYEFEQMKSKLENSVQQLQTQLADKEHALKHVTQMLDETMTALEAEIANRDAAAREADVQKTELELLNWEIEALERELATTRVALQDADAGNDQVDSTAVVC